MRLDYKLRQKTWGVFIKPYLERSMDKMVIHNALLTPEPFGNSGSYVTVKGGEPWMLYKTTTSFSEVREIVKLVMDDMGYSIYDITVTEIIPADHIVTPLT